MELAFSGWSGIFIMVMYGLIMLGIGVLTYMRNRKIHDSLDEYYLGGRGLSMIVLFFTFYATQYSGNTIVGYAPTAYRAGFAWIQSIPFMILVIAGYLLFAPRLYVQSRKYRLITPADWLEKRFRSKAVTIIGSLLMLYALGNYLLEQLVAIGHGVAGLTGGTVPYQLAVVFFIVIMLIYGWLGGMRSVAYTDTMQGIALLVGVFLLLIGSVFYFGGLPTAADYMQVYAPEKLGVPDSEGIAQWFSLLLLVMIGVAVYPHAIQRIFSARSEQTLKQSLIRMAWMPFITTGVVLVVGLIGISAFPDLNTQQSEQLVGMMANAIAAKHVVFYWAMVLLFGGIIAAIISTADSVLLTFSSIISRDLYGRYIRPDASEKKQILVGKIFGVIAVGILLLIAWFPPGTLYQIFVLKMEVLVQIAPAFMLGLYWKRLQSHAVCAGMISGTLLAAYLTLSEINFLGVMSGIWGLLLNLTVCVLGSWWWNLSSSRKKVKESTVNA